MKQIPPSGQAGFSLIELAIALVIIGLIVGGILLKGGDLIDSARLKTVLSQVNEIRMAVTTFQDRYNALPGDYDQAKAHINNQLADGGNDGIINGDGLKSDAEAFLFWSHLAAAQLIPDPGKPQDNTPDFGHGAPAAKIGGGFTIEYIDQGDMQGHWIVLGKKNGAKGKGALLTPLQAMHLDQKADDGNPSTGRIRAANGEGTDDKCLTDDTKQYNAALKKPACIVYFQLF